MSAEGEEQMAREFHISKTGSDALAEHDYEIGVGLAP